MVEIQEIDNLEELASYRLLWQSWLAETPRATFFHTWDWLDVYWRHFGRGQKLRALLARSGGTPIGILPLCVRTEQRRLGRMRVLSYPLDHWGTWYGPVGSNRAATMLAAMQHIRHARRDWDVIDLRHSTPPSRDGSRVGRSMSVVGLLTKQEPYETASVADFAGGWNDYLAGKSRDTRHEMRRLLRRTFADPAVEYIRHRPAPAREGDGDPGWDLFSMCEHVALASWQATSTTGNTLTHERVRHFLRDAHAVAARLGMLDMNLLVVDGRPAAFIYNYHFNGQLTGLRSGFVPSFRRKSAGTALMLRSIEDSCERGDQSYDLGPGESPFQRRLRTHTETSYRLTYLPVGSWRCHAARLADWAKKNWQRSSAQVASARALVGQAPKGR